MSSTSRPSREELAARLRRQAAGCRDLGSIFYAELLERAAVDLAAGGPTWELVSGREVEPSGSALALRFMGAVNRLVLAGELPELASLYPSDTAVGDAGQAWPLFRRALADREDQIRVLIDRPCQTNEVGRSASLLGGFLEVSRRTRRPLRLVELGASAGLNLRWDCYRYEAQAVAWGEPDAAVRFQDAFEIAPDLSISATVASRRGCDLDPIDPLSKDGALTLRAFVWPDQRDRVRRLDGALRVAATVPADIQRSGAADFLERELRAAVPGTATVVFHSVFLQYVGADETRQIAEAIENAAANAPRDATVHRLSMEPADGNFEVRLDGELLGTSGAHGKGVRWLLR